MISISYFTKYSSQGATSRYRSFAFALRLMDFDYNIEFNTFMPSSYLADLFAKRRVNKFKIVVSYFERLFAILRSADNVIIERELFPYLPFWFEKWFLHRKKYIVDFDDNVWEDYRGKKILEGKYDHLVKNATGVIVGNDYLNEYVKKLNSNVIKIPTVINLDLYDRITDIAKFERFTLIWIGSPVTYCYIETFAPMFQKLSKVFDFDLIIVASKSLEAKSLPNVSMLFYEWSSESEIELLKRAHIGIMPLSNDLFSQGKLGFKLIQYQAAGLPLIASPVGENNSIVLPNVNGFLPSTEEEWIEAVLKLYHDTNLYQLFAHESKKNSYNYSIQKYFTIYKSFIDKTFERNT